jgi:hypothetical protein
MDLVQDQDLHAEVAKKADCRPLQLDDCRARVLRRADDSEDLRVKPPLVRSTRQFHDQQFRLRPAGPIVGCLRNSHP